MESITPAWDAQSSKFLILFLFIFLLIFYKSFDLCVHRDVLSLGITSLEHQKLILAAIQTLRAQVIQMHGRGVQVWQTVNTPSLTLLLQTRTHVQMDDGVEKRRERALPNWRKDEQIFLLTALLYLLSHFLMPLSIPYFLFSTKIPSETSAVPVAMGGKQST